LKRTSNEFESLSLRDSVFLVSNHERILRLAVDLLGLVVPMTEPTNRMQFASNERVYRRIFL
jgi:hypothetical protein